MPDVYIDSVNGLDANNGSSGSPIQTIAELMTKALAPNDTVYMARGSVWRETYTAGYSGTDGNPITFVASGTGDNPRFDDLVGSTGWTLAVSASAAAGGDVYYLPDNDYNYFQLALDLPTGWIGSEQGRADNAVPVTQDDINSLEDTQSVRKSFSDDYGSWARYLRIDSASPDGVAYFSENEANGGHLFALDMNGHDYLTFDGIDVRGYAAAHESQAVYLNACTGIVFKNGKVELNKTAISSGMGATSTACHSCQIIDSEVAWNIENGIYLLKDSSNNVVARNDIHHNYAVNQDIGDNIALAVQGSDILFPSDNIFEHNDLHHNGTVNQATYDTQYDSTIALYAGHRTQVRYNKIRDNIQNAYYTSYATQDNSFYYNEVYRNESYIPRFIFSGNIGGAAFYNNVVAYNVMHGDGVNPDAFSNSYRLFSYESGTNNCKFKNNIVANNTVISTSPYPCLLVCNLNPAAGDNNEIDYNNYYGNVSQGSNNDLFHDAITAADYSDLSAWKAGTSFDAASIDDYPKFVDPASGDFRLASSSRALDAGVDVGLTTDANGDAVGSTPSMGAHQNGVTVAETSNLLTDVFATPDYIDSLALSNEQPTSIDADYDVNIDSGVAHWVVWDKDSIPAVVDLAAIQAAVGAADSGSATITATGAQTTITPTVTDTETVSYRFYIVWVSGADESRVYARAFGAPVGDLGGVTTNVVTNVVERVLS